ncbi:hypothetical protein B0H67DRAFT_561848 [Lasiosphaeris hirsuta]|uniref:Uncharacterized protein n=1 Tax=Lasiosphaeris hirsuta TaxID=260670 RepID=A0AA40ECM6_9PEZI|nr:hypothetical protein B0H67DRAFT_561848 [Lasiosphaeris hirsuta]
MLYALPAPQSIKSLTSQCYNSLVVTAGLGACSLLNDTAPARHHSQASAHTCSQFCRVGSVPRAGPVG